ncbi:hypothetical protein [Streptomyces sp. NPDC014623]|uniref:hypothetical protein n=1 Tax=Streptomyces sp. NPDC014623 TaxID=3364875 RepID=UPI0036FD48A0
MAFPQTPLDVRTELRISGTWTDVTGHVYHREPITIERGMKDEGTRVDPSRCSLVLNNRDGRYSPRNPLSPYYGLIGRNTPIRVSVQGPESYLQLDGTPTSYARTPDAAALDITGDLDLRVEATANWTAASQALLGKWISATNQRSYLLRLENGSLILNWSPGGTTSQIAFGALPALPRRAALRATLDVNNGAGGHTIRMYWAESLTGPWTDFTGPIVGVGTTSIYASTAPLEISPIAATGITPLSGRVHRAEVRSGLGGTLVAAPDVRALTENTTSWADFAGRTWTLGAGATISDREYRFTGEVSSWPARWDVSGADVWVPIEAAGVTRRMGQGKKALDSTLRRRIPSAAGLLAYWPMEDGDAATQAYSPVAGVLPLSLTGADWAAEDTLGGSAALPKLKNPSTMLARVPRAATAGWQVEFVYHLPTLPATQTELIRIAVTGAAMASVVVYASTAGIRIEAHNAEGDLVAGATYAAATALAAFTGAWNRLAIYSGDAGGGTTRLQATWRDVSSNVRYYASASGTTGQGRITSISGTWGAGTTDMAIGHLAVFSTPGTGVLGSPPTTAIFEGADDGFAGESAITRMVRLTTEESAQTTLTTIDGDTSQLSQAMGPQRPDTLLALLEEAAATDGGILYEDRDSLALTYRDRATRYNQPVALALAYSAPGEVPPPLEPTEDDQRLRNDATVIRRGGSSGRAVLEEGPLSVQPPPAGVGPYDEAVTLSLHTDAQTQPIAEWRVHLGTWDEARYPTITVWLHAAPHLIDQVLSMDIGDRIQISNPPPWLPPGLIDQHMHGYTEILGLYEWSLAMNCAPAGPWTVGVVEDPVLGRADTDGCVLTADISASFTAVAVTSSPGPRWIDSASYPAMFPFDVTVGGEVMRVTACTGTGLTQTLTVTRSINGIAKTHAAGTPIKLTHPMRAAL